MGLFQKWDWKTGFLNLGLNDDEEEVEKVPEVDVALPDYASDEFYGSSQGTLSGVGTGLAAGNVPDYYKDIGQAGGAEFEQMLGLGRRDIERSGLESAAKLGVRGGRSAGAIAGQVSDYETRNRYADYARSLKGKEFLLGKGLGTLSGVRSGAISQSQLKNQFALSKAGLDLNVQKTNAGIRGGNIALQNEADAASGSAIGSILGTAANVAANVYTGGAYGVAKTALGAASSLSGSSDGLDSFSSKFDFSNYYS